MTAAELIGAIAVPTGAAVVAWFGLRRGKKNDDAAADKVATEQVYSGYGGLLASIQNDNKNLREIVDACNKRIDSLLEKYQGALDLLVDLDTAGSRADILRLLEKRRIEKANGNGKP